MIVDALWDAARTGRFEAPGLPGPDLDRGQALSLEMLERWCAEGYSLGGWKLGLTSGRSRDAFGSGIRPFGYILRERIFPSGSTLQRVSGAGIETELCWVFAEPLAGGAATASGARAAVAGVAPAFELNQNRLPADAGPGLRVADDLSQWGLVVGPMQVADPGLDLDGLVVTLLCDGEVRERVPAAGHIDDHYESLARLARELSRFGRRIEPGNHVITGAYARQPVDGPGSWRGEFGVERAARPAARPAQGLGAVEVHFERDP